ncbi:MAG TPA: hypothetical protein VGM39_11030 [Kofleriaceae bacterium]
MAEAVRPEYVALADHLEFLRGAYRLPCTTRHRTDVATTLSAFECIDRHYDGLSAGEPRRDLGARIVRMLAGSDQDLPAELESHVRALRAVFAAHDSDKRLATLLEKFFVATERVRTTPSHREYVDQVRREGHLTSEMVLILLGGGDRFARFFLRLGVVGNLVDKLVDVREDHALGEISVAPTIGVHARLLAELIRAAVPLVIEFPRRFALARWGVGVTARLLR